MLQVVPKWKVTVKFKGHDAVVWINETHIENVLRQVASMQFTENGLERATAVIVTAVTAPSAVISVQTGYGSSAG